MALFKNYVNSRVEPEYYAALEQPNRGENSETLLFLRGYCFLPLKLHISYDNGRLKIAPKMLKKQEERKCFI